MMGFVFKVAVFALHLAILISVTQLSSYINYDKKRLNTMQTAEKVIVPKTTVAGIGKEDLQLPPIFTRKGSLFGGLVKFPTKNGLVNIPERQLDLCYIR